MNEEMSKERYNQIIDGVYMNYISFVHDIVQGLYQIYGDWYGKKEFINKCKTDSEFSEKWGLQIEERELSREERNDLRLKLILEYLNKKGIISISFEDFKRDEDIIPDIDWRKEVWDGVNYIDFGIDGKRNRLEEIYKDIKNVPTKLITITYNNETIEIYENI